MSSAGAGGPEAARRRRDLVGLVRALEPPDETTLYASVYLAQRWGLFPQHYAFSFSTNLPFSPEMACDYHVLIRDHRLLDGPGPDCIRVHPRCPPEEVPAVDEELQALKGIRPAVLLAVALLHHLADDQERHPDLGSALRHWCLVPAPVAEQALEIFRRREGAPVSPSHTYLKARQEVP